jgi:hypothetical protein
MTAARASDGLQPQVRDDDDAACTALNASLVQQVEREARHATALPRWFWTAAVAVLGATLLVSHLVPLGWATGVSP